MHAPPPAPGTREKRLSRRFLSGTIHYKNGTFHMFYCSTGNKKYRLIPQSAHKSATCFHAKSTASCLPCEPLPARRPFAGRPDALSMQNKNQRIRHIHEPNRPQTVRCHTHKQTRGLRTKAACRTRATSQPSPIFAWPAPLPPLYAEAVRIGSGALGSLQHSREGYTCARAMRGPGTAESPANAGMHMSGLWRAGSIALHCVSCLRTVSVGHPTDTNVRIIGSHK